MDGMLSQEEINALLGNASGDSNDATTNPASAEILTDEERDAIGEISNICMGTAATTLYSLVNQKVTITTPKVSICTWDELVADYEKPCVFITISYKEGIEGNNVLILREDDVKVITDLMMGGDGTNLVDELSDLHLSAICEAMNQMMGSSATSLSSMLGQKIDISPPKAELVNLLDDVDSQKAGMFVNDTFVKVFFKMEIGDLVDSSIMQLYPIDLAKELYKKFASSKEPDPVRETPEKPQEPAKAQPQPQPMPQQQQMGQPMTAQPMMGMGQMPGGQPVSYTHLTLPTTSLV